MISHSFARRLVKALPVDAEMIAPILQYIDEQWRGPSADVELTDREHSIRAANRAIEASSRVGTLNTDLEHASKRITTLEASQGDLQALLAVLLNMVEGLTETVNGSANPTP